MSSSKLTTYGEQLGNLNQIQLYREALRAQMAITWPCTKDYLEDCKYWLSAKIVSDLGCGPGDLILLLADFFPDKTYSGFDLSSDFIETAKKVTKENSVKAEFGTLDLTNSAWPKSDFKILRAVLQHIRDLDAFIIEMDKNVSKEDIVLIYDAADDQVACMTEPPIEQWEFLMENLAEKQKQSGGNRNAIFNLLERLPSHWKVLDDKIIKPQIKEEDRFSFAQYVLSVGNLLPKFFNMEVDLNSLTNQVIDWLENSRSNAWIKARWVMLQKI